MTGRTPIRQTKVIIQVRTGRHTFEPKLVTANVCADGKTRIPWSSYNELIKAIPAGNCFRMS